MPRAIKLLLLFSLLLPVKAFINKDFSFDKGLYETETHYNPELDKEVNFSFQDIKLSDIFLLLSKVGEFNVIFPEQLDRSVSIAITQQKIIDAITDLAKLYKLDYVFNNNSLIISGQDENKKEILFLPLSFVSADHMLKIFSEDFLKNLDSNEKIHINKDPSGNNLIIICASKQITAIKNFINTNDVIPYLTLTNTRFLSSKDLQTLSDHFLADSESIAIKEMTEHEFVLKGEEKIVENFQEIIYKKDQPSPALNLIITSYDLSEKNLEILLMIFPNLSSKGIDKMPKNKRLAFLQKAKKDNLLLKAHESRVEGLLTLQQKRNLLDDNLTDFFINEAKITFNSRAENVIYILNKKACFIIEVN